MTRSRAIELYSSAIADACIEGLAESLGKSDYVELAEDYAENTSVVDVTEKKVATKRVVTPEEQQHLEKWMTKKHCRLRIQI